MPHAHATLVDTFHPGLRPGGQVGEEAMEERKLKKAVQGFIKFNELYLPPAVYTEEETEFLTRVQANGDWLGDERAKLFVARARASLALQSPKYTISPGRRLEVITRATLQGEGWLVAKTSDGPNDCLYALVKEEDTESA